MDDEFEELSHDVEIISRVKEFRDAALRIKSIVNVATEPTVFDKLSNSEKIKYNLLMSYSLNSLFWMYLRAEGIDPTKHQIKAENERLKKSMLRAKQINDKNTLMPRVNKEAAQRFVRSSLWEPTNKRKRKNDTADDDETCES